MKKLLLGVAVFGLLVSCGEDDKEGKGEDSTVIETKVTSANAGDLTIGYYDAEKLVTDFDFMRETDVKLKKEGEAIQKKMINWQTVMQSSYQKLQDPSLSVDQQLAYDRKMQNAQKQIQQIEQTELYDLQERQAKLSMALEQKLLKYSEEFGKANGIKLIFARGAGSGISYIDEAFDITDEFIKYMNAKEKAIEDDINSSSGLEEK
ncbi:MAG: hypothetical protein Crog4KO_32960 [Crocinitomicaceae bacterium]